MTRVLTLLCFAIFATILTFRLIYFFNPDKEPLPWRAYCSVPPPSSTPPDLVTSLTSSMSSIPATTGVMPPPFPPVDLDQLPPAGVFVGVFSMDSSFERRMLVRTTWAGHPRSRDGAGEGDGGNGTSRTIVRFVLGQPRKEWEQRIRLEMEMYNDIVILPIPENMNSGKSWNYFAWAAGDAWVPPLYFNTTKPPPMLSYANLTNPAPSPAPHDPILTRLDYNMPESRRWVRPDYVVKVDDDSFVMLAELEARLRLELHAQSQPAEASTPPSSTEHPREGDESTVNSTSPLMSSTSVHEPIASALNKRTPPPSAPAPIDPLVYWGYLVKNRFMAGELYALSWSLTKWVASDPTVKTMIKGAEDKQTSKWMRIHPQAADIRWTSERCWIYDHPRAGTVYSHGFLFPSEATRVRRSIISYPNNTSANVLGEQPTSWTAASMNGATPTAWAHSSVSTFGTRYTPPVPDLSTVESVEALVEGSDMSLLREGSPMTSEYAWAHREGRKNRYENKRVGGTVVVHFIKKHMWFLETAIALLESDEFSESETQLLHEHDAAATPSSKAFSRHRR
ncbi:hypothetical protein HWV62_6577 [Athelia sp. TMB]|nr:hypothetical protein HWV62_6577 [Athelia sp. TMB]